MTRAALAVNGDTLSISGVLDFDRFSISTPRGSDG